MVSAVGRGQVQPGQGLSPPEAADGEILAKLFGARMGLAAFPVVDGQRTDADEFAEVGGRNPEPAALSPHRSCGEARAHKGVALAVRLPLTGICYGVPQPFVECGGNAPEASDFAPLIGDKTPQTSSKLPDFLACELPHLLLERRDERGHRGSAKYPGVCHNYRDNDEYKLVVVHRTSIDG